jgi:hypothetical protein
MRFFLSNFKWIMLISGLLTCTMLQGLISPETSFQSNFGETVQGPAAGIIVRNWSALIGLMGIMLIYGAFVTAVRRYSLVIAGISKVVFICLILSSGSQYFGTGAGTAVIVDSVVVVLFIIYLLLSQQRASTSKE